MSIDKRNCFNCKNVFSDIYQTPCKNCHKDDKWEEQTGSEYEEENNEIIHLLQ